MVFNHLQRYLRNADQSKAEKCLRFCTGSSVICVDQIKLSFDAESGLSRRPVAHTCGATLDLSYTYSSYQTSPQSLTTFSPVITLKWTSCEFAAGQEYFSQSHFFGT